MKLTSIQKKKCPQIYSFLLCLIFRRKESSHSWSVISIQLQFVLEITIYSNRFTHFGIIRRYISSNICVLFLVAKDQSQWKSVWNHSDKLWFCNNSDKLIFLNYSKIRAACNFSYKLILALFHDLCLRYVC